MSKRSSKVVQISSVHPSNDTRIFYKICKSLAKEGYSVDLIIQHERDEIKDGINIYALPIAQRKSDRPLKIIPTLIRKCLVYPKRTIIHFHDPELIPVGLILKILGYKIIYDVHEDVPKDFLTKKWIPNYFRKPLSLIIKIIEKISSPFFNAIVTVVPTITERFRKYNENVHEIRNFPIIEEAKHSKRASDKLKENPPYVVYVGSLTSRRGVPKLVDAIELVKNKDVQLWLGGSFGDKDLEKILKNKKGWSRTNFLGWVSQEKIFGLMEGARAGLMTLEVIPSHEESYNVKLFEYMYAEIPVIITDLKLPGMIVSDFNCGIILNEHTAKDIANAIDWIMNHPQEAVEMGKNGKKAVLSKFSWEEEEKILINLYKNLLKNLN